MFFLEITGTNWLLESDELVHVAFSGATSLLKCVIPQYTLLENRSVWLVSAKIKLIKSRSFLYWTLLVHHSVLVLLLLSHFTAYETEECVSVKNYLGTPAIDSELRQLRRCLSLVKLSVQTFREQLLISIRRRPSLLLVKMVAGHIGCR